MTHRRPTRPRRTAAGLLAALTLAIVLAPAAPAQLRPEGVARSFFPPRLVLVHAEAIGLTDEQRATIEAEARNAGEQFADLRYELEGAMHRLIGLAREHPVDEAAALAQLDEVLDLERRIKRLQLAMAVRVKNALAPEQQEQLRALRRRAGEGEGAGLGEGR